MESLKELELNCHGLGHNDMALLLTMKLVNLKLEDEDWEVYHFVQSERYLKSFVGSNISQTLESFSLIRERAYAPNDDYQVATALASSPPQH
jgi:hypothetical protein